MRVALVYVLPNVLLHVYVPLAQRFAQSYIQNPPGTFDHELHVVVNGHPASASLKGIFNPLPVNWHEHNNFAKDLGAYMLAAAQIDCDVIVCLGSHTNFRRAAWLDRMMQVYLKLGPGLYGCWGFHAPAPHIRTTAFWLPPDLLRAYPHLTNETRYAFEHSHDKSILKWTLNFGLPVVQVGWNRVGVYPDFYHSPAEENLLFDQHCS